MAILWKLEQDFKEELESALNVAKYNEPTIKELLDLGFNNNYLMLSNGRKIELGYININGERSKELTKKQLNVKILMDEDFGYDYDDTDGDGYHIAKVRCLNKRDEVLFDEEYNKEP